MKPKTIAIDFDDTFTADPELWGWFITRAKEKKHQVLMVSCRRNTEENQMLIDDAMAEVDVSVRVLLTNLGPKLDFVRERGFSVDIWVDDDPACILRGK